MRQWQAMGVLQFQGAASRPGGGGQDRRCRKQKWGFMSMTGRMVVPCLYDDVLDFNNRRYWKDSGFDDQPDQDERSWTIARNGNLIGMIDNTGKIMVPIAFGLHHDSMEMIFHKTQWGELASARDPSTKKHGLIDRQGRWVLQPKYEEAEWESSEKRFYGYTDRYDSSRTFVGYDKTPIDLSD